MGYTQELNQKMEDFVLAGYELCGAEDDGFTIFMFVNSKNENDGFTLSLRDHEGNSDHNAIFYEGTESVPESFKPFIISQLNTAIRENENDKELVSIFSRGINGL